MTLFSITIKKCIQGFKDFILTFFSRNFIVLENMKEKEKKDDVKFVEHENVPLTENAFLITQIFKLVV